MPLTRKVLAGTVAALTAFGLAGTSAAVAQPELPESSLPSAGPASSLPSIPFAGTWVDVNPSGGGVINFDNGRISGTDGCNGIGSTYTVDGNVADVEPTACTGPWSRWLPGVSTVHHYGGVLVVYGDQGDMLGALRPDFR